MLSFVPVTLDLYRTVRRHLHWTLQNLVAFADRTGRCFPSVRTLAAATGTPRSTVSRHLAQLAAEGVIARQRRPGGVYAYVIAARFLPAGRGVSHSREKGVPPAGTEEQAGKKTGVRASAICKIRSELRRDPRRARQMGAAPAVLAAIAVLAAVLGSEAERAGLFCPAGGAGAALATRSAATSPSGRGSANSSQSS